MTLYLTGIHHEVYAAILAGDASKGAELAALLGYPPATTQAALAPLVELGVVARDGDNLSLVEGFGGYEVAHGL